jgi:hypothetical protein
MAKIRFNNVLLNNYCSENNITLLNNYTTNTLNRNTIISGFCNKINCKNTFSKSFRNMLLYKACCKDCINETNIIKRKETCINRYGCENPQQNKSIKEKTKQTCLNKYGCENPGQNEEIKNKMKTTNLLKYNCLYPCQNILVKNKIKTSTANISPSKNQEIRKKIKNTNLIKYGYEHCNQNPEIAEKISKNCYKSKIFIFPSGNEIKCQGYEPFALQDLIDDNIKENNIITGAKNVPEIWYNDANGKKHRHFVDIFIPSQNKCIEVKSKWTVEKKKDNIFLKQSAAKDLGYKYEIWVYNNKKEKIICYD